MYSEKDYLFFDYSRGEEDISRVVEVYKDRPIYVLFKTQENRKLFEKFKLNPAGPIRSYQLMIE
jgi:predicted glycosyltransferase